MRKDLLGKTLVMGVIILFVGVGVQPAFAVESRVSSDNIENVEDCDCQEIDNEQLGILMKELNSFDINANKLPLSFRDNPEIKELTNRISTLKEKDRYPFFICLFLMLKEGYHWFWEEWWLERAEEYSQRGQLFLSKICGFLADRAREKAWQTYELAESLDCLHTPLESAIFEVETGLNLQTILNII